MALFPGLPRWAGTRKVKPIWILLKQETVSGSSISWAICKSAPSSKQITMPAPHHSVFYRPDALPAAQPTASKHWRHYIIQNFKHFLPLTFQRCNVHHFRPMTDAPVLLLLLRFKACSQLMNWLKYSCEHVYSQAVYTVGATQLNWSVYKLQFGIQLKCSKLASMFDLSMLAVTVKLHYLRKTSTQIIRSMHE